MVQRDYKRMIASGQDFLLSQSSLDLVSLDHLLLAQDWSMSVKSVPPKDIIYTFHSIQPAALFLPDQVYLSNISLANQLYLVKASWANLDIADLNRI